MCSYASASASRTLLTPSSLAAASATPRQPLPATSTCTSPSNALAAVNALLVASLSSLLSCSATRRVVISDHSHLVLELLDQLADRLHLDAGLAAGRLGGLQDFESRRDVDAIGVGRLLIDRLLLRLHDVGQAGVARLVEPQVGGHDRRRLQLHRLQPAVDLAGDEKSV